tara:strand:+ start:202 stop:573 length:372 start_codon:yes stop_codon:yes gene_type:complete
MADIPQEYQNGDFDFGFTSVDEDELNGILSAAGATTTPDEILAIKDKLDQILEINATCDGASAVKEQYDELLKAKLLEVEKIIVPLLINLKKNKGKDYIYWPGAQREAQCDLQIQKVLNVTRD